MFLFHDKVVDHTENDSCESQVKSVAKHAKEYCDEMHNNETRQDNLNRGAKCLGSGQMETANALLHRCFQFLS